MAGVGLCASSKIQGNAPHASCLTPQDAVTLPLRVGHASGAILATDRPRRGLTCNLHFTTSTHVQPSCRQAPPCRTSHAQALAQHVSSAKRLTANVVA